MEYVLSITYEVIMFRDIKLFPRLYMLVFVVILLSFLKQTNEN